MTTGGQAAVGSMHNECDYNKYDGRTPFRNLLQFLFPAAMRNNSRFNFLTRVHVPIKAVWRKQEEPVYTDRACKGAEEAKTFDNGELFANLDRTPEMHQYAFEICQSACSSFTWCAGLALLTID